MRRDFEKHIVAALQKKGAVRKVNVFMEMVGSAKNKRLHEQTIASTQTDTLAGVESWAAGLNNERYLAGVPILLLRQIKEKFGCQVEPHFIDFNAEEDQYAKVNLESEFREAPTLVSDIQIKKDPAGRWYVPKIEWSATKGKFCYFENVPGAGQVSLDALGASAEAISEAMVGAIADSHKLRHAHIQNDLQQMMPRETETPGEVNLVLYGGAHAEIARRALKTQSERVIVMASDKFYQRIPKDFRKHHSSIQYAYAHQLRLLGRPLDQQQKRRIFLMMALEGALRGLGNIANRYFQAEDKDLIADSSFNFLTSQMAATFSTQEVNDLWSGLFPSKPDFEMMDSSCFPLRSFWQPMWLSWLTERYYPGGKELLASGEPVAIDPRQFPAMFRAMVQEHFCKRWVVQDPPK